MSGQASSPPPKDQGPVSASSPDLSYQNESGEENIPLVEESIGTSDLVPSPPRQAREINQVGDAPATGAGSHQADDQLRSEYDRRSNDSQLSVRKAPIAGRTVEPVRIGLWGAPSSGKTTMLAALGVSLGQGSNTLGKWLIVPENDSSSELLTSLTHRLVISRRFPEPTPIGAMREISWNLVGDIAQTKFAPRRKLWVRGSVECRFRLNLVDVSGESFGSFPIDQHIADSALDILTEAHGIVYLFDPIGERDHHGSAEYIGRTLNTLSMRMADRLRGGYLPQQLSVCITKFDHPEIFQQARRWHLIDQGEDGTLRVLDHNAERFFDLCCSGQFWDNDEQSYSGAHYVRNMLRSHFAPERTRYFVSSSIGLRRSSSRAENRTAVSAGVNPDDFVNVLLDANGDPMIRGFIEPVNVLEPVISLQQRIVRNVRD